MLKYISEESQRNEAITRHKLDQLREDLLVTIWKHQRLYAVRKDAFGDIGILCTELAEEGIGIAASHRILSSLYFKYIKVRQAAIKEAHAQTFEWTFADTTNTTNTTTDSIRPETGFLEWMKSGNGIYWISRKAGSGKSTLIK
jgi:hypothetical protein